MTGTGGRIADYFRSASLRLSVEMLRAENDNARTALNAILKYSSGDISTKELRALGHPYAPGRVPPQDPAIINVQSEEFVNAWHQDGPRFGPGGSIVTTFENTSVHALLLDAMERLGRMQPRPLVQRVEEEIAPIVDLRRQQAVERAFGKDGMK